MLKLEIEKKEIAADKLEAVMQTLFMRNEDCYRRLKSDLSRVEIWPEFKNIVFYIKDRDSFTIKQFEDLQSSIIGPVGVYDLRVFDSSCLAVAEGE